VFTWTSAATDGRTTTVSVELAPHGTDETELTLVHEGLPDDRTEDHRSGWGDILRKLEARLGERSGA
jgi:hypothetical protein